jgi:hypothetical protein
MLDVTLSILALIAGGITMELFTGGHASTNSTDECVQLRTELYRLEDFQSGNPS